MKNPLCKSEAIILELQATNAEIFSLAFEDETEISNELIGSLMSTFLDCIGEISERVCVVQMTKRVPVMLLRGRKSGCTGTIAGTLADRKPLQLAGLTKIIVRIGSEFFVVNIEDVRELSLAECILLGID